VAGHAVAGHPTLAMSAPPGHGAAEMASTRSPTLSSG
jgi:hypothetical protein